MPAPIIYYGNLLQSGTLSVKGGVGEATPFPFDPTNSQERMRDGNIGLGYVPSGTVTAGVVYEDTTEVALTVTGHDPDSVWLWSTGIGPNSSTVVWFVLANYTGVSGIAALHSATYGVEINADGLYIADVTSGARKPQWQYYCVKHTALVAWGYPTYFEAGFSKKWVMPRAPEVGVTRTKVRQFARAPIAGGQPFVNRTGPLLRQSTYNCVLLSGTEVTTFHSVLDAIDGGQIFPFTDDQGFTYMAELLDQEVNETDSAGVYTVSLTFREVRREGY